MLFSINNDNIRKLKYILQNVELDSLQKAIDNSIDVNYKLLVLLKKGFIITIDDGKGNVIQVNKLYKKE